MKNALAKLKQNINKIINTHKCFHIRLAKKQYNPRLDVYVPNVLQNVTVKFSG